MATITQRPSGLWQAQVRRKGFKTLSKSFNTKTEASKWAKATEADIDRGLVAPAQTKPVTLADALNIYEETITPTKKGARQEHGVIKRIRLHCGLLDKRLEAIRASDWSQYRDKRLKQVCRTGKPVTGSTVCRELALISHLYTVAIKVWSMEVTNPTLKIQKPKENPARSRRVESLAGASELDLICSHLPNDRARAGVLLLLETACRRGELVKLTWANVDFVGRTANLRETKTGGDRVIPLSLKAVEILRTLHTPQSKPQDKVLGLSGDYLGTAWHRAKAKAKVGGLRIHDLRRSRISELFEAGLNTLEVSSISGHKTLQMLKRYTNLQTSHLLARLDSANAIATAKQSAIESIQANEVQA